MMAFGPVPSRRLGHSLGINNIPPKICTYSCVYCQLGRTLNMQIKRMPFYNPEDLLESVEEKIKQAKKRGESIDYLTFVPDGEPTLDNNIGREIDLLKSLGIRIAVITNASLMGMEDVRNDLMKADWVSLKIDAFNNEVWRKINRPHRSLKFDMILEGMLKFSRNYKGELATETMLVKDLNDNEQGCRDLAKFLQEINPSKSYLSVPIRPPAEKWAQIPGADIINVFYQILREKIAGVEYLLGYEGNAFAFTGNVEEDILSITSVHPMREDAVRELLSKAKSDWSVVDKLMAQDQLIETEYEGRKYYIRRLVESKNRSGS
ncbi:radical SAM protein [Candidatus Sumerlaeota bacterium]|nr:radical SAM protein [Candidatus Sumerlaeota bacterium]